MVVGTRREGQCGLGVTLRKVVYYAYLFYMMSGEDSLTSSESSSLFWECMTQSSSDRYETSAQMNLSPPEQFKSSSPAFKTSLISSHYQPLQPRSELEIRNRYLSRLQRSGLLPEQPRKKIHHQIVFDWDDTLFCTSFMQNLLQGEWNRAGEWQKQKVEEIDRVAASTLELALTLGEVGIVTNSVEGWVDYSSQTFMPLTYQVIVNKKIPVFSARDRYQNQFPSQPQRWKTQTFMNLFSQLQNEVLVNIVSIGDSSYQIEAAEQSTRRFDKRFIKTIKLRQKPRAEQLLKQLKLVNSKLSELFTSPKTLTIKLQPKQ